MELQPLGLDGAHVGANVCVVCGAFFLLLSFGSGRTVMYHHKCGWNDWNDC